MLVSMQKKMMAKLISVIIALCFCFSTIAAEDPDEAAAKEAAMKCKDQLKLSDEKLTELHNQKMMVKDPKDEEGKCFIECMMKEFKLLNDGGDMNIDEVMKNSKDVIEAMKKRGKDVSEESLRKTMEECSNKGSGVQGRCASSYMIWECLHDKLQKTIDN